MTNSKRQMTKEYRVPNAGDETDDGENRFWGVSPKTNGSLLREGPAEGGPKFDLEERTARFGEAVVRFAKKIPMNPRNNRLIDQFVCAGTAIGANYCEADDSVSKREFKHKIGTCKKEARETKFFLRMIAASEERLKPEARELWQEAKELHLIFSAIYRKCGKNDE